MKTQRALCTAAGIAIGCMFFNPVHSQNFRQYWDNQTKKSEVIYGKPDNDVPQNSWYHGTTKWQKNLKTAVYTIGEKTPGAKQTIKAINYGIKAEQKLQEKNYGWYNNLHKKVYPDKKQY